MILSALTLFLAAAAPATAPATPNAVSITPQTGVEIDTSARLESLSGPLVIADLVGERPVVCERAVDVDPCPDRESRRVEVVQRPCHRRG